MASAILLAGCRRIGIETGDLVLHVSPAVLETKADPSAAEGELFNNLLIVITDADLKPLTGVNPVQYWEGTAADTKSLEFRNIPAGTYEVFAFANISADDIWGSGLNLAQIKTSDISSLLDGDGKLNVDKTFTVLSDGAAPAAPGVSGMLLTGRQTVTIDADHNSGTVTLMRPVARLKVLLRNYSGLSITLDALSFTGFNAPTSYLVDHRSATGIPGVPALTYGALPAFGTAQTLSAETIEKEVYSTLLYESAVSGKDQYKMFAQVTITKTDSSTDTGYLGGGTSAPGTGAVLKRIDNDTHSATNVTYIRRNEELTIIINVYYGSATGQVKIGVENWINGGGGSHPFK